MLMSELPPALVQSAAPSIATEPKLLETSPYAQTEVRRYLLASPSLPLATDGTISVFRTAAAWADPSVITQTVYFFHSGGADDRQLAALGTPAVLETLARGRKLDSIQIVCPAISDSFLSPAYAAWFETSVRPWAEAGTATRASGRWTSGASMGGFVALSQFLAKPADFAGVAANAPALLTWDFFDAAATEAHSRESGLPLQTAQFLAGFFRQAFTGPADYRARDPLALLQTLPESAITDKSVYLDVGALDDLGLQAVTARLQAEFARRQPRRLSHEVVPGAHHDPAYMSGQLQKTLQFIFE